MKTLAELFDVGEWGEQAACRAVDFDVFFPEGDGLTLTPRLLEAKRWCWTCPVRRPCLLHAMEVVWSRDEGVYGGATGAERRLGLSVDDLLARLERQMEGKASRRKARLDAELMSA